MQGKVGLACSQCRQINYYTTKSQEQRLRLRKYCKSCNLNLPHLEER